jgi:HEAT repeat protein
MKILPILLCGGLCAVRLHALESAELAAVTKKFANPSGDEQYKARAELNRLVAQSTLPGKGDPAAVSRLLLTAIQSPDTPKEAVKYLLRSLSRIATADAVEPLVEILNGPDTMLREEAREALSWIQDPKASAALEAALAKSTDKREKLSLIAALAARKSATSITVLAPSLRDADPAVAFAAIDALSRIGGAPAVTALAAAKVAPALQPELEKALLVAGSGDARTVNHVYQSTASAPVRLAAFIALMKLAPDSAKPAVLEAAMKNRDDAVRQAALAKGLETNLPSLQSSLARSLPQMTAGDRLIVLANIHHLKPADAAAKLALGYVGSSDEEERVVAISSLGKIPTQSSFDALLQAVGAREPRVSQAAATAMGGLDYPEGQAALLAMLKGGSSQDKVLAIKALNSVQVPDACAILLEIVKGPDQAASKEAVKTLYFIASVDDLRTLSAAAAATTEPELRKNLVSISSRIATRINTDEARDLVKDLK